MTDIACGGDTEIAAAVGELMQERRHPGIVIVLSDFLVSSREYEDALGQLLMAHHEVKVVHVMGEQESNASYPAGGFRVRDCETGEMREVVFGPREAEACRRRIERHADELRRFCTERGIVYAPAFGATHLDEIMVREFPRLGVIV